MSSDPRNPPVGDVPPVPVHVVADSTGRAAAAPPLPGRGAWYETHYETVVLTASNPAKPICGPDGDRVAAWVQALDYDIVIGPTSGVVGSALNTAQSPATPTTPTGTVVPAANGAPYPVEDNGPVWAGATNTAASSRVAVTIVTRRRD